MLCYVIISCFIKMQIGLTFLVPAYQRYAGKAAVKRVGVSLYSVKKCVSSTSERVQIMPHYIISFMLYYLLTFCLSNLRVM